MTSLFIFFLWSNFIAIGIERISALVPQRQLMLALMRLLQAQIEYSSKSKKKAASANPSRKLRERKPYSLDANGNKI
jgi:hypothetical protein